MEWQVSGYKRFCAPAMTRDASGRCAERGEIKTTMSRKKIIFDTDPGIDDAMALLFLHQSPQVELVGITTGPGNGTIDVTTRNALYLKERFGIAAPVARGAAEPLTGKTVPPAAFVHGQNALGDIPLPEHIASVPHDLPAYRFIVETARRHPGEISILAVGRMTNLALALREDPEIAKLVEQVVIMGGAFGHNGHSGNVSPVSEANIDGDPLAADEVFAAAWPLTAVGLDVTKETRMSNAYLRSLADEGGEVGQFIWEITRFYEKFHLGRGVQDGIYVHDSSAAAFLLDPSLFVTRTGPIRVVTEGLAIGQTIQKANVLNLPHADWDGRPSHAICTHVDSPRLLGFYRQVILHGIHFEEVSSD